MGLSCDMGSIYSDHVGVDIIENKLKGGWGMIRKSPEQFVLSEEFPGRVQPKMLNPAVLARG